MTSIARKNMLILIFSFIPFMVGIGYSIYTSIERIYLSTSINMAGAQRMRTMLLANYAQQVHYGTVAGRDVTEQRNIMERELITYRRFFETLQYGDSEWDVIINPFPTVALQLSNMNDVVVEYEKSLENLLEVPESSAAIQNIVSSALAIRDGFHEVTEEYQILNDRMINHQRAVDTSMLLFAAFVTISGLFLTKKIRLQEERLIYATRQAEAASRAKSEFLANMSHEIRTPLNGVIGFTSLLKSTPLSPVQQEYVNNANVSGHTLLGIITHILDFSKIEAGMLHLEMIKTDMIELLENSIDIVNFQVGEKNLEMLLHIDQSMPRFAVTDPIRLKQILSNLLSNAIKFTEKGEVELKVQYKVQEDGLGKLSFSVRDTGIGITEEQQKKLFKPFSQADNSTTRKYGGTGLGLIISDLIARKMGSKIEMDSKQGEGTTFYFEIITEIEEGERLNAGSLELIKRCLIIDDNANNRLILEEMLASWGVENESCDNGLAALKLLETTQPFDVVICDYNMPYIDGLETIRMIRNKLNLTAERQPAILLHSSSDDADLHKQCDELGVRFKLTKPVKGHDLHAYLCQVHEPEKNRRQTGVSTTPKVQTALSGKINILIADDVKMNIIVMKSLITNIYPDAILHEAVNGLEAVKLMSEVALDIIFMDVQMPKLDGLEATKKIRKEEIESGTHVPIIALTAGAFKEDEEECLAAGMDDFLTKPVELRKIKSVLMKYFAGKDK